MTLMKYIIYRNVTFRYDIEQLTIFIANTYMSISDIYHLPKCLECVLPARMRDNGAAEGHGDRYIGSLFRVDEPVPDDSGQSYGLAEILLDTYSFQARLKDTVHLVTKAVCASDSDSEISFLEYIHDHL